MNESSHTVNSRLRSSHLLLALMAVSQASSSAGTRAITGQVLAPDGRPAPGAEVRIFYCHDRSGYGSQWVSGTKADGSARFRIGRPTFEPPAVHFTSQIVRRCYLVAGLPGHAIGIAQLDPEEDDGYVIGLHPGRSVTYTVLDGHGAPLEGARVMIRSLEQWPNGVIFAPPATTCEQFQALASTVHQSTTDEVGRAVLKDVPRTPLVLSIEHGEQGWTAPYVYPGGNVTEATRLSRGMTCVQGRVTYGDTGQPAAGVLVVSHHAPPLNSWTLANGQGEFELYVWNCKSFLLRALDPAREPSYATTSVRVDTGLAPVPKLEITMPRGVRVSGRALDMHTGKPVCHATVVAAGVAAGYGGVNEARTCDARGEYQFRLAGATASLHAEGAPPGYVRGQRTFRRVSLTGDLPGIDLELEVMRDATRDIVIMKPDGKPASRGKLFLLGTSYSGTADGAGRVRVLGRLWSKAVPVYATTAGRESAVSASVAPLQAGGRASTRLRLSPTRTGTVTVEDVVGRRFGASVALCLPGAHDRPHRVGWAEKAEPKVAGVYLMRGLLPEVEYTVTGSVERVYFSSSRETTRAQWLLRPEPKVVTSVKWRFHEDESAPKLLLKFQNHSVDGLFPLPQQ